RAERKYVSSAFSKMSRMSRLRLVFRFGCACSKRVSNAVIQTLRSAILPSDGPPAADGLWSEFTVFRPARGNRVFSEASGLPLVNQKYSFKANWITRGATEVFLIVPNVGSACNEGRPVTGSGATVPAFNAGFAKDGVLNALKNSALNSSDLFSPLSKTFLMREISKFL